MPGAAHLSVTMRTLALLALIVALSACTDYAAQRRAFLASLVGQPEATAVRALGVPTRTYQAGGTRFLAYDQQRTDVIPSGPFFGGWGYFGGGYYSPFPPEIVLQSCETTLEVSGGVVRAWNLRGTLCG